MKAEELLRAGHPAEALQSLQEAVRSRPEDPKLRIFLFEVLSVLGQWERAANQLEVLSQISAQTRLLARVHEPILQGERLREEIFAGRRAPVLFGEPEPWMSFLVQANELVARSEYAAAAELRDRALDAAPATGGTINGTPFAWLADADSRMGPVLEVMLEGRYLWVPYCRVSRIRLVAPKDLRDLIWAPASFQWVNGGEATGHIPVRYPETHTNSDDQLRLSRRTDWIERADGYSLGLGQRILTTDQDDYPLLELRDIVLTAA